MAVKTYMQDHAGIVHIVMGEPEIRSRGASLLADKAGLTYCGLWFRWFGYAGWARDELIGQHTDRDPTCIHCVAVPNL